MIQRTTLASEEASYSNQAAAIYLAAERRVYELNTRI